jgi:hypothetical protein
MPSWAEAAPKTRPRCQTRSHSPGTYELKVETILFSGWAALRFSVFNLS